MPRAQVSALAGTPGEVGGLTSECRDAACRRRLPAANFFDFPLTGWRYNERLDVKRLI